MTMRILTSPEGAMTFFEVFNPITFATPTGEKLTVYMRNSGYELTYCGETVEMKGGNMNPKAFSIPKDLQKDMSFPHVKGPQSRLAHLRPGTQVVPDGTYRDLMAQYKELGEVLRQIDANVGRRNIPDIGSYNPTSEPFIEAIRKIYKGEIQLPIPELPAWNGCRIAEWTRFAAEMPTIDAWYEVLTDGGILPKWWSNKTAAWYGIQGESIQDLFAGRIYWWRNSVAQEGFKHNDISPAFLEWLTRIGMKYQSVETGIRIMCSADHVFSIATAWGQYKATHDANKIERAIAVICEAFAKERGYYEVWKYNIASAIQDEFKANAPSVFIDKLVQLTHGAADRFLATLMNGATKERKMEGNTASVNVDGRAPINQEPARTAGGTSPQVQVTYGGGLITVFKDSVPYFTIPIGAKYLSKDTARIMSIRTIDKDRELLLTVSEDNGMISSYKVHDFIEKITGGRYERVKDTEAQPAGSAGVRAGCRSDSTGGRAAGKTFTSGLHSIAYTPAKKAKLKIGQLWGQPGVATAYEIMGFGRVDIFIRAYDPKVKPGIIQANLAEFRHCVDTGYYKLKSAENIAEAIHEVAITNFTAQLRASSVGEQYIRMEDGRRYELKAFLGEDSKTLAFKSWYGEELPTYIECSLSDFCMQVKEGKFRQLHRNLDKFLKDDPMEQGMIFITSDARTTMWYKNTQEPKMLFQEIDRDRPHALRDHFIDADAFFTRLRDGRFLKLDGIEPLPAQDKEPYVENYEIAPGDYFQAQGYTIKIADTGIMVTSWPKGTHPNRPLLSNEFIRKGLKDGTIRRMATI